MSRDDEYDKPNPPNGGADLGSGDGPPGRWGRCTGTRPDRAGMAAVGPKGKPVDGRTRAGRALRAGRKQTVSGPGSGRADQTRSPAGEAPEAGAGHALPTNGSARPRATGGVRFPAIRTGEGRKSQYGSADLGVRLRVWRERAQLSQSELAMRVGVSSPNISHYERGTRAPSKEVCKRLRIVLGLTDAEYIQLLEWA